MSAASLGYTGPPQCRREQNASQYELSICKMTVNSPGEPCVDAAGCVVVRGRWYSCSAMRRSSGEIKASRRKAQIDTQWEEKKATRLLIYLLTGGGTG